MKKVCTACGTVSKPKTITKGSVLTELFLWLLFLLPGMIYSVYRLASRYKGCSSCGSPNIVSIDSPIGKKLLKETEAA